MTSREKKISELTFEEILNVTPHLNPLPAKNLCGERKIFDVGLID